MPKYFFHVDNGSLIPDTEGTELSGVEEARAEAVSLSGAVIQELGGRFWSHGAEWAVHVTNIQRRLLFSLHFTAKTPSGKVKYEPSEPR